MALPNSEFGEEEHSTGEPPRLHQVRPHDDLKVMTKDEPAALISDGLYQAQCLRWEKRRYRGGWKLYVWFRICDGPHMGTRMFCSFNYQDRPGRGTKLFKTLTMLYGKRVPKGTHLPLSLFMNKIMEVKVRTVVEDDEQDQLPEHMRYSVIHKITRVLVGGNGT